MKTIAEAHHNAIRGIDGQAVTSASDYEAVKADRGGIVDSGLTSKTNNIYNAWRVSEMEPSPAMFRMMHSLVVIAAAKAFYGFDVVVNLCCTYKAAYKINVGLRQEAYDGHLLDTS